MDEELVGTQELNNTHKIYLKNQGKEKRPNFIVGNVVGRRSKIDVDLCMLHVIGYWDTDNASFKEVWIPLSEISHVESLVYRHKG
jgi:hypothetical protein